MYLDEEFNDEFCLVTGEWLQEINEWFKGKLIGRITTFLDGTSNVS